MFLRQSTASQEILLGPFVDDADGKTAETALTIAATDIKLWKGGATTEANKNSGGATHIASGRYSAVLDATDTDTVGMLEVNVAVAGALPVRRQFYVLEEAVFDAMFAAGATGYQVPIWSGASATVNLSGTTISTTQSVASVSGAVGSVTGAVGSVTGNVGGNVVGSVASVAAAVTVGTINANAVNASALATDAVTEIQSGLATAANLSIVVGYLDTEVSAIKAVTDKLDTAMVLDGAVYQFTANALELGPSGSGGTSDWTADERTAIRTILGVPASGTTPEVPSAGALKVIDDLIDTEIASLATAIADVPTNAELTAALGTGTWATAIPWNTSWDAEVQSECTDALNAYDPPTNSEFEARTILAASYATAVEVAKVIKTGEAVTKTRSGKTDVVETVTRN